MSQKKVISLIIIFVVVLVLILGGIWYWQSQEQSQEGKVNLPKEKLPEKLDTSTWLPYVVGYIQFRYPADWKIEEREVTLGGIKQKNHFGFITQNALAQIPEITTEIILSPPTKQSEKDVIKIGGKVKNCRELKGSYKCVERIGVPIYTASKLNTVMQTFNNLVETFDTYFEVADLDTGMAIDRVRIAVKYVPVMTAEEFRTGTYKYCFECITKERDAIRRCSDKCGVGEEKIFTDKHEFRRYLKTGPLGTYIYTVESEGYAIMSSYIIKSGKLHKFGNIMMMPPLSPAPELHEEYIRSLLKPRTVLVVGFVVDNVFRKPLGEVTVSIPKLNLTTKTNARGFYFFNIPEYSGRIDSCEKMIETALTFRYSKNGFKIYEHGQLYPVALQGPDVKKPFYLKLNAAMFYGTGKIVHEYILPGACQGRR